jgi:type I restriction enzyme S subunit
MSELPEGWVTAALGDVCGQPAQRVPSADEKFTYIDIASIDRERKIISEPQRLPGAEAPSRARKLLERGDVIVSMTRPNLNAVALVGELHNECIASTGFDVLKPFEVEPRWIFAAVRSTQFVNAMCDKVQGALYPAVKSADIREHEIPLPPLAEQTRIVQKLDELLAQVDTLKARIDGLPALLKRFRQSVLAAAISGRLTEEWRTENSGCDVAEQINTILSDRLLFSKSKKAPATHLKNEEHEIPKTWRWVSLDSLSAKIVDGTHHTPTYVESGVPFISVKDIRNGVIDFSSTKFISAEEHVELCKRCRPQKGDLLITKSGTIGRTALINTEVEFSLFVSVALIKPASKFVNMKFIDIALMKWVNEIDISSRIVGSAIKNLHLTDMKVLAIPFAPLEEQTEIVRRVVQLFAFADQLENKVASAKSRIDHLTQSILAKAFRGELVPQDPNDEPASVLLERIQALRAATPKAKRGRKASA